MAAHSVKGDWLGEWYESRGFLQEQRERTGSFLKALHLRTSEKHRTSLKYNERHCLKAEHLLWLSISSPRGTTSFLLLTKQLLPPFNSFIFRLLSYLILSLSLCKVLGRAAVSNNNYIRENLESTVLKQVSALDKWMNVGSERRQFYQGEHPASSVTASLVGWGQPLSEVGNLSSEHISTCLEFTWPETWVHIHAVLPAHTCLSPRTTSRQD